MFLLKTKGKARGYVEAAREREAVSQSNVHITVQWPPGVDDPPEDERQSDGFAEEIIDVEELPGEDVDRWG